MTTFKWKKSFEQLGNAIARLKEATEQPKDQHRLVIDATIQRFEFTIELFWKTLKRCLQEEGIEAKTPKETLIKAYQAGWLDDDKLWLLMLKDRNATSHLYNEGLADQIYSDILKFVPELIRVYEMLDKRFLRT
jgi:nucleotidyltransferase substrate binding protein (TIGR01987 family)